MPNSADVKQFLARQFPDTQGKDWKRLSKSNTAQGVMRVFQHVNAGQATVEENTQGDLRLVATQDNTSEFWVSPFSLEQLAAARKLMLAYNRMARVDEDAMGKLRAHPDYALGVFDNRQRTVRESVQDLIGLGLRYAPHHPDNEENCLFEIALTQAGALTPRVGGTRRKPSP